MFLWSVVGKGDATVSCEVEAWVLLGARFYNRAALECDFGQRDELQLPLQEHVLPGTPMGVPRTWSGV